MDIKLKIWRQKNAEDKGGFETYALAGVSPDMSFLEMMDVLNEQLLHEGQDPVMFDNDCREGICGMCSLVIIGEPHGPVHLLTGEALAPDHVLDVDSVVACRIPVLLLRCDGDLKSLTDWRIF